VRLILASASPRRADLLRAAGFDFEIFPATVDERLLPGETPSDYVQRLAIAKTAEVWRASQAGDLAVLGADTAVVVDTAILGKPRDEDEAREMLERLAGQTHEVLTGVSIRTNREEVHYVETTSVAFAPMSQAEIAWYVSTGEGQDKAGAYGIQGLASRFVVKIEGSYPNVVGLPIASVSAILNRYRSQKSL
jgi:septum formation protein